MNDPTEALANEHLVRTAFDLQVQLEKGTAMRPVLWLLAEQRAKAREAMVKLVEVDATETDAIRALQQEIRLYGDLVTSCQELIAQGRDAYSRISESDRSELAEIIGNMSAEDQRLHGFEPQSED